MCHSRCLAIDFRPRRSLGVALDLNKSSCWGTLRLLPNTLYQMIAQIEFPNEVIHARPETYVRSGDSITSRPRLGIITSLCKASALQRLLRTPFPCDILRWMPLLSFISCPGPLPRFYLRLHRVGDLRRPTDPHMSRASVIPFFLAARLSSNVVESAFR